MTEVNRKTQWYEKKSALYIAVAVALVLVISTVLTSRGANDQVAAVDSLGEYTSNSRPPESITDKITGSSNPFEVLLKQKSEYVSDPIESDLNPKSNIKNDDLGLDGMPRTGESRTYIEPMNAATQDGSMSPEAADAYNRMVITLTSPLLSNAEGSWTNASNGYQGGSANHSNEGLGSPRNGVYSTVDSPREEGGRGSGSTPVALRKFNALSGSSGGLGSAFSGASRSVEGGHGRHAVSREYAVDFEIPAGNILEGYLTTAVNSDLPGDVVLQISRDVYDMRQETLLVPKGSRLIGRYEDQIAYGQNRVLQIWDRLILPSGDQFEVPHSRGVDLVGTSGVAGRVNNHWGKLIASATLVAVMGTAYELTQREQNNNLYPSRGSTIGSSISNEVARVGAAIAQRGLSIKPTIQLPVGHPVKVLVRNSWVFSEAYERVW